MNEKALSPIEISKEDFMKAGHQLVDQIADFISNISRRPVTTGESPGEMAQIVGTSALPEHGSAPDEILNRASELLFNHSLLNGHPKFFGYITSSAAPIGALADLIAAAVNPNVGANILSPAATEIENQTIRWLTELTGLPSSFGGILVSGGNMANLTAFLAAITARAPSTFKSEGLSGNRKKMVFYCSRATHAWIEKAAVLFGLGTGAIRWIETGEDYSMNIASLAETIRADSANGLQPFMVVANAGDVSTGSIDDLEAIAAICRKHDLWMHVDGAYGLPASIIPEMKEKFRGITDADSIAIDPHKWLYVPLEAGCTLMKDPDNLKRAFSAHPVYYNFQEEDPMVRNYYEYGLQNSRGFRALKVWCTLQQAGRDGFRELIQQNIRLSEFLYEYAGSKQDIEVFTHNLSIVTFRYKPTGHEYTQERLNELNQKLLNSLQKGGELFLSNAVLNGNYCLRTCIVNFRTTAEDVIETIDLITREGKILHEEWRKEIMSVKIAEAGS